MPENTFSTMNRREFLKRGAAFTAMSALFPSILLSEARASGTKNIVFIIADQHRWDVTGCYGNEYVDTPNIDRLAGEGVRFDNMYCQFPVCVPSRQSIITSQYPSTHGTMRNVVPRDEETLIDYLRNDQGYHTCLVGKSHMSTEAFDLCVNKEYMDVNLPPHINQARKDALNWYCAQYSGDEAEETKIKINASYLQYPLKDAYYEDSLTCRATREILSGHSERPMLMWVSFLRPHTDWTSPDYFMRKYRDADLPWAEPATPDDIEELPQR